MPRIEDLEYRITEQKEAAKKLATLINKVNEQIFDIDYNQFLRNPKTSIGKLHALKEYRTLKAVFEKKMGGNINEISLDYMLTFPLIVHNGSSRYNGGPDSVHWYQTAVDTMIYGWDTPAIMLACWHDTIEKIMDDLEKKNILEKRPTEQYVHAIKIISEQMTPSPT